VLLISRLIINRLVIIQSRYPHTYSGERWGTLEEPSEKAEREPWTNLSGNVRKPQSPSGMLEEP